MTFGAGAEKNWRRIGRDLAEAGDKTPEQILEALELQGCISVTARRTIYQLKKEGRFNVEVKLRPARNHLPPFLPKDVAPDRGEHPNIRQARWLARARANQLHLIDLKRAGHSPTRTERYIPADLGKPTHYMRAVAPSSYYGSSAAMCAELGTGQQW